VVEHDLAKVGVEGSSPFARSRNFTTPSKLKRPAVGGLFFSIGAGVAEARGTRFSVATDVIASNSLSSSRPKKALKIPRLSQNDVFKAR
jgi:hypothetical protein